MIQFGQYVVGGLATGSLYALVALGIVLLYRSSRVLNFAHGDIATLATFVAFTLLGRAVPFAAAVAAGLLAAAALGAAFFFFVLRPAREASLLGKIVITLGLALVLSGVMLVTWGADTQVFPFPLSDTRVYRLGGVVVSEMSVGTIGAGMALMGLMYGLVQRTTLGLAMRAVAQDATAAQALGIPARRIYALTWGLASALGGAAGVLLAPVVYLDPYMMLDPFLKGFAAAVLGGIDSLPGAVVGGFILGIAENVFAGYVSFKFKTTLAFAIIVLVLTVRPEGLLGREYRRRV
ncbi:MAG: branched-chain amino acid ABC transporter permease [Armatimonadota bacterium]|nr:branched-chain amino acid ABC transporter permease [Armatimonadota bacterium]MDR7421272.1 branched-chain amino acid ABC transporter permease [Armatimonadota bacterium]MDR7455283.1 branched-chain amino acid ABC transporter permease [Armatimonadota bacterium]MDR7455805.1 branched-chain amino acid ABC transporter permease [Armatimonadota bacterium]MDR7497922.1 branched-chain amino acid ABC transporter permease [Armatimonadota bacterium]